MRNVSLLATAAAALVSATLFAPQASAACFSQGCTDRHRFDAEELARNASCGVLWEIRNSIFKERGYCFKTARAIRRFGNAGCQYDEEAEVPLSGIERDNVAAIRRAERLSACRN